MPFPSLVILVLIWLPLILTHSGQPPPRNNKTYNIYQYTTWCAFMGMTLGLVLLMVALFNTKNEPGEVEAERALEALALHETGPPSMPDLPAQGSDVSPTVCVGVDSATIKVTERRGSQASWTASQRGRISPVPLEGKDEIDIEIVDIWGWRTHEGLICRAWIPIALAHCFRGREYSSEYRHHEYKVLWYVLRSALYALCGHQCHSS